MKVINITEILKGSTHYVTNNRIMLYIITAEHYFILEIQYLAMYILDNASNNWQQIVFIYSYFFNTVFMYILDYNNGNVKSWYNLT